MFEQSVSYTRPFQCVTGSPAHCFFKYLLEVSQNQMKVQVKWYTNKNQSHN